MLDVILTAPDSGAAHAVQQQRYGFTKVQASAVMDLQFRRMASEQRDVLERRRAELVAEVAALEVEVGGA